MTVIVGLVEKGKVYVGGDSAGVNGHDLSTRADKKVFVKNDFIFGFTSSFRMGQLLQYSLVVPDPINRDLFSYMVTDFVDAIRLLFREKGYKRVINEEDIGGHFIVGTQGRLFEIDTDFQVSENVNNYTAVGSGSDLALGAMWALQKSNEVLMPEVKINRALQAAEQFSTVVTSPFTILSV